MSPRMVFSVVGTSGLTGLTWIFGHPLIGLIIGVMVSFIASNPEKVIAKAFDVISENPVRWAIITAAAGVFFGGIIFSIVEVDANLLDGWWWAFISMTTVGYGDLSPKTPEVRIVAVFVVVTGVLATAILTAALAGRVADIRQAKRLAVAKNTVQLDDDIEQIKETITTALEELSVRVSHPKVVQALHECQQEQKR